MEKDSTAPILCTLVPEVFLEIFLREKLQDLPVLPGFNKKSSRAQCTLCQKAMYVRLEIRVAFKNLLNG